jgi:hypothetical protein
MQLAVPVEEANWPAAQPIQLVDTEAPVDVRYNPLEHDVHDVDPGTVANLPAAQPIQLVETEAPVVVRY